ncbi:hypothetical protein FEM03_01140 [Phragmitibacter flavus]|uniref:RTX pore-forming domain-containing protein n=1 Tax=Phragmitibacter flavus TaxID=2576071 RepID=A0A5R8KKD4_9BACT|nr:hypothetical protein [Phragmitibacter flavus]TLD72710.1 hypothetical protein FEM03_01140 [Phragmitibacter flavus]
METEREAELEHDQNLDPITGEPSSHPVGTGVGALGGGLTGAAIGAVGGPVGIVIGAAAGSVAGGLMGKNVAESQDPTDRAVEAISPESEESHWQQQCGNEAYFDPQYNFADYAPAYRLGYETKELQRTSSFEDLEGILKGRWQEAKGDSRLSWEQAQPAVKAVWNRWA